MQFFPFMQLMNAGVMFFSPFISCFFSFPAAPPTDSFSFVFPSFFHLLLYSCLHLFLNHSFRPGNEFFGGSYDTMGAEVRRSGFLSCRLKHVTTMCRVMFKRFRR